MLPAESCAEKYLWPKMFVASFYYDNGNAIEGRVE